MRAVQKVHLLKILDSTFYSLLVPLFKKYTYSKSTLVQNIPGVLLLLLLVFFHGATLQTESHA